MSALERRVVALERVAPLVSTETVAERRARARAALDAAFGDDGSQVYERMADPPAKIAVLPKARPQ